MRPALVTGYHGYTFSLICYVPIGYHIFGFGSLLVIIEAHLCHKLSLFPLAHNVTNTLKNRC